MPEEDLTIKLCSRCKIIKPLSDFNFKYREAGIRHAYCRECGKLLTRNHYQKRKQLYLDRNARAYARHRELIRQHKSKPCDDCGVQYPYYVMDFDHREGEHKEFILSNNQRTPPKAILLEIKKCDVVCANCHRERTHQRRIGKISPA
jgi:hypothetical protein